MRKECVICGDPFEARNSRQKSCSAECQLEMERRRDRAAYEAKRPAAGTRAGQSARTVKVCAVCGGRFGAIGRAKTCSVKCSIELRTMRRREYVRQWRDRNVDHLREKSRRQYVENRAEWEKRAAEKTAAMQVVRRIEAAGVAGLVADRPKIVPCCAVCGEAFQPKKYRQRYTLCGKPQCQREWGRRSANRRHHGEAIERHPANATQDHREVHVERTERERQRWRRYASKVRTVAPEKHRDANRRSAAKRAAALRLIRELQSKGMEALL